MVCPFVQFLAPDKNACIAGQNVITGAPQESTTSVSSEAVPFELEFVVGLMVVVPRVVDGVGHRF